MSAASPAKLDLKSLADDFRNLSPNDVGAWPLLPRVAVLLGLFVAILAAGWWFVWNDQLGVLEERRLEEGRLREEFVTKKTQAVNLELYKQQMNEIDRSFGALLKQLPNKAEIESFSSRSINPEWDGVCSSSCSSQVRKCRRTSMQNCPLPCGLRGIIMTWVRSRGISGDYPES